jgi:hypothetical protein
VARVAAARQGAEISNRPTTKICAATTYNILTLANCMVPQSGRRKTFHFSPPCREAWRRHLPFTRREHRHPSENRN